MICGLCNNIINRTEAGIYCFKCNYYFLPIISLNNSNNWNENSEGSVVKFKLRDRLNYKFEHFVQNISLTKYFEKYLKLKSFL